MRVTDKLIIIIITDLTKETVNIDTLCVDTITA